MRKGLLLASVVFALGALFVLGSLSSRQPKVDKENLYGVKEGMRREEVEAILGPPVSCRPRGPIHVYHPDGRVVVTGCGTLAHWMSREGALLEVDFDDSDTVRGTIWLRGDSPRLLDRVMQWLGL
jgi:hypothetical protein